MPVIQGLGREFTEEEAVIPGEAAEVPNTKLGGDLGDGHLRRVGGFERCPNLVECSPIEILQRRYTEILLEGIAEGSLRNACDGSKLLDGKVLAVMLIDKVHRHANDLSSRNHMPPKCMFGFAGPREHVADLANQFLLGGSLRRG